MAYIKLTTSKTTLFNLAHIVAIEAREPKGAQVILTNGGHPSVQESIEECEKRWKRATRTLYKHAERVEILNNLSAAQDA